MRAAAVLGFIGGPGVNGALGQYSSQFNNHIPSAEDTWETTSLSGAPFNIPANAVVEVALYNADAGNGQYVGVRSVGSSLNRRFNLQESEPFAAFGRDHVTVHVQVNAASQIQVYSSDDIFTGIYVLGYWSSGTYVERFDSFTAGASGSWQDVDLCAYGVGPRNVAEIVMTNDLATDEQEAGVRSNGSALQRRFDLREAETEGVDAVSAFVQADGEMAANIEVYAETDANIDFYLVGYWSEPPGAYTEPYADIGSPTTDGTWEDIDLSSMGVPDDAVVEIASANEEVGQAAVMGVRPNGSTVDRLPRLNEAEDGGAEFVRMHAQADATATIEFRHDDVSDAHTFRLLGYWDVCDSSIEYVVSDLGAVSSGHSSLGWHVSDGGEVAGFEEDANGDPDAWHMECGTFTSLGVIGGSDAEAQGINDSGMVVGWSDDGGGNRRAFTWTNGGGLTNLGTAGGRADSEAFAVNNSSEVVGTVLDFDVPQEAERQAFLHLPAPAHTLGAGMNLLGTLGGEESVAMDINDAGQVVGGAETSAGQWRPFRWADGTMTNLGTLGGETANLDHRAEAVNSNGNACGRSYTAGGAKRAFYYDGSMTDLGVLTGGSESWAFGINDSDVVVGTSDTTGGVYRAFVWDSVNGLRNLNNLLPTGTGWTLIRATDINNHGSIVGFGTNGSAQERAFLLTPTCGVSGGASMRSAILSAGTGATDESGSFTEDLTGNRGSPLGRIEVSAVEPGIKVDHELFVPETTPGMDRPVWEGTREGFAGGLAISRSLRLATTALQPDDVLTITMAVERAELLELGVAPDDMALHVLFVNEATGIERWILAATPQGAARPTTRLGDAGYVERDNGRVEYWAVRNTGGIFAVGAASTGESPEQPRAPRFCGLGFVFPAILVLLTLTFVQLARRATVLGGGRRHY